MKLTGGNADFPWLMTDYHIPMCPANADGTIDWKGGDGAGPYKFVNHEFGVGSKLVRHDGCLFRKCQRDAGERKTALFRTKRMRDSHGPRTVADPGERRCDVGKTQVTIGLAFDVACRDRGERQRLPRGLEITALELLHGELGKALHTNVHRERRLGE